MRRRLAVGLVLAFCLAAGCRRQPAPEATGPRHPVKGKAVSVNTAERTITLAHQDIPGFMPAMTMEFVVLEKDAPLLGHVSPGDLVTATLVVADSRYWLEDLVVVKEASPGSAPPAVQPGEARIGAALPDVTLVDQDGRSLRLRDLRGHAVALSFVYTRCPLPDFCPLMMRHFAQAETQLLADPALRQRTRLLTVSFDVKNDTPPVLRAFGLPFQRTTPPFSHWLLLTGKEPAIRTLGGALGLDYVEETDSFTHNLRTAVVDPQGRLRALLRGNEWTPLELVGELRRALEAS
ncbi:MAG TPA: SCO family protein [Vicinamibacteria bacterium]|nr:SCO family protein [Vicinamibacteria bacterium]